MCHYEIFPLSRITKFREYLAVMKIDVYSFEFNQEHADT